jgi:hypothetical protein
MFCDLIDNLTYYIVRLFEVTKKKLFGVGLRFNQFVGQIWFEKKNHCICEK